MMLHLFIEVPKSAGTGQTFAHLHHAAKQRQGVTITTADGFTVDVDLYLAEVVDHRGPRPPVNGEGS